MNTHQLPLLALLTALSFAPLGIAAAEDFTITVPVTVSNMRAEVTAIRARCIVGPAVILADAHLNAIGAGVANAVITESGNLTTNLVVKLNAHPGRDPTTATHYRCYLELGGPGGPGSTPSLSTPTSNAPLWTRAKAGTTFTPEVTGTLPQ